MIQSLLFPTESAFKSRVKWGSQVSPAGSSVGYWLSLVHGGGDGLPKPHLLRTRVLGVV